MTVRPAAQRAEECEPADLVARIRAGDPEAESELVQRYSRGLSAILRRAGADRGAAEDLYQEAFRIALVKIRQGDLREPSRLAGFLASLARNLAIDHFRRREKGASAAASEAMGDLPSPEHGPLERVLKDEQAELVRRVLAELGLERDRQMLFRFYVAEEDKASICAALGLSSLQFNRVLFRARQRYKELYDRATNQGERGAR